MRFATSPAVLALLVGTFALPVQALPSKPQGIQKLQADASGAQVSIDNRTGYATFVRLPAGTQRSLAVAGVRSGPDSASRARAFMQAYGSAFGVDNPATQLRAAVLRRDSQGAEHAIFQQVHQGLPVFGGELRVHFREGQLFAANGRFVAGLDIGVTPSLAGTDAATRAVRAVLMQEARKLGAGRTVDDSSGEFDEADYADLKAAATDLMVFRSGLLQGVAGRDHLVYRVEVRNEDLSIREFVFVDAHKGDVVDQITGIHDALDRRAYDAQGAAHPGPNYPGNPFWVEGQPLPTGNVEADNMIFASGETYSLFLNAFGRDSFDGLGAIMDAIFNRGDGCPNASWNGTYISFCAGTTSDDVTAHEWGHAYTEYTNNLIYQWQSGALNESYSDIWGETVDLINGRGTDSPDTLRTDGSCSVYGPGSNVDNSYRWLMGEDASAFGAPIRDMWTPTCAGDPGKVSDTQYYCLTSDQGGVHSNSGVPNHAYALMVDGGTYNGLVVAGIGLTKAAHIHWAAQNMLTPSSNFVDQADALEAACDSLLGVALASLSDGADSGEVIDAGDCAAVANANLAVEFRTEPTQCGFEPLLEPDAPALCEGLGALQTISLENFEGGALPAGWTASSHDVANPGTFDSPGWSVASTLPEGANGAFAAFAPDLDAGDCAADTEAGVVALDSPPIVLPVGQIPHVAFDHWVATEAGWDGGNVKVSVNGGPWTLLPGAVYSFNPYNGAINAGDNPLASEAAFTGTNGGEVEGSWGQSQVELFGVAFPGDTVRLRFDFGVDGCSGVIGWYVDDVHVYSCADEEPPVCGNGQVEPGEMCDDGNAVAGDGCSASCQVEAGWSCTGSAPAGAGSNVVGDWSFEGGVPNADWLASSTFTGIAGFPLCGPGNGCPAVPTASGSWTVWIGGLAGGVTSSVQQDVTIPAPATELTVQTLRGVCDDAGDTLHVKVDGNDIGTLQCDGTDGAYVERTFPIAPFNDGLVHTLSIGGTVGGTNGTHSNFFVDEVSILDNTPTPATPSMCTQIIEDIACNAGAVGFDEGIQGGWAVVDNAGQGVIWTNIQSAFAGLGANYTGGAGDAASVSSDAAGVVEFDTELRSNSFSLAGATSASLDYLVNYNNYRNLDFLNLDISVDGGVNWTNLLSWNEDHGSQFSTPGEAVSVDLSSYLGESDVRVRWHYYDPNDGDWDWYAQVDEVALTCEEVSQMQCDIDNNGVVDRTDISLITAARNQPAAPGDPRDNDGNGVINVVDARQCTLLCTLPRCAPQP